MIKGNSRSGYKEHPGSERLQPHQYIDGESEFENLKMPASWSRRWIAKEVGLPGLAKSFMAHIRLRLGAQN